MKLSTIPLVATLLLAFSSAHSQEIPKGVNYKRASDEVNALAKNSLESTLATSDSTPVDFFGDVTVVGPMLWKALKPSAGQVLLNTLPVVITVPGSQPVMAEGKRLRTDDERKAFWKLFHTTYTRVKDGKVRKGNAAEISYYWSTIPFDIEEPFWVIEAGADRFIAHFQVKGGQPRLFWIDLVGDLQILKP
ncbi:MAG: hypothetical protein ND895_10560 [Pyrinomonadaceae bacterium]|nr:hypothetical protein [Pyrinomonadaceae bacterium]